jgi:hypothetical protein
VIIIIAGFSYTLWSCSMFNVICITVYISMNYKTVQFVWLHSISLAFGNWYHSSVIKRNIHILFSVHDWNYISCFWSCVGSTFILPYIWVIMFMQVGNDTFFSNIRGTNNIVRIHISVDLQTSVDLNHSCDFYQLLGTGLQWLCLCTQASSLVVFETILIVTVVRFFT